MLFRLAERGATDVLVPNLPDVGMTPAARLAGQTEIDRAECLTPRFNEGLETVLRDLEMMASVRLYRLDVAALAERARIDPAAFGFVNVTTPCIGLPSCEGMFSGTGCIRPLRPMLAWRRPHYQFCGSIRSH